MKYDDFGTNLRDVLSEYIGKANVEGLAERVSGQVLRTLNEAADRLFIKPPVGSYAYVSRFGKSFLEPDTTLCVHDDSRISISITLLGVGATLLVLDDDGGSRGKDMLRVLVLETGTVGWTSACNLVAWP